MKKSFILIGLATATIFAGCNKDETIEIARDSQAIRFDGFVDKSVRARGAANDIDNSNFTSFQVWGLMQKEQGAVGTPFDGTQVTNSGGSWGYTTPVYWEDGYKYSFVAIAPAQSGAWTFTEPTTVGAWGTIAFSNGDGTTDLIYDIDDTYATTPVSIEQVCPAAIGFTFNHLLSRVKFVFENGMDDGSVINVTGVKIDNANTKAEVTLGETATWNLAGDNAAAELAFGDVVLDEGESSFAFGASEETDHKYMIPAMSADQTYTVSFTVTRTHSGVTDTYNHTVNLPAVTWQAGNSYAFTAAFDAGNINPEQPLCPITFTANVTPWESFVSAPEIDLDVDGGN